MPPDQRLEGRCIAGHIHGLTWKHNEAHYFAKAFDNDEKCAGVQVADWRYAPPRPKRVRWSRRAETGSARRSAVCRIL